MGLRWPAAVEMKLGTRLRRIVVLGAVAVFAVAAGAQARYDAEAVRLNNRGVAQMGQQFTERAAASFAEAFKKDPKLAQAALNEQGSSCRVWAKLADEQFCQFVTGHADAAVGQIQAPPLDRFLAEDFQPLQHPTEEAHGVRVVLWHRGDERGHYAIQIVPAQRA